MEVWGGVEPKEDTLFMATNAIYKVICLHDDRFPRHITQKLKIQFVMIQP